MNITCGRFDRNPAVLLRKPGRWLTQYAHWDHYLREIQEDLKWYGRVYSVVPNKYEIEGKDVETVVKTIIQTYKLLE